MFNFSSTRVDRIVRTLRLIVAVLFLLSLCLLGANLYWEWGAKQATGIVVRLEGNRNSACRTALLEVAGRSAPVRLDACLTAPIKVGEAMTIRVNANSTRMVRLDAGSPRWLSALLGASLLASLHFFFARMHSRIVSFATNGS